MSELIQEEIYLDCPVICEMKRQEEPIITKVQVDEFTDIAQKCFDFNFDGLNKIYPYIFPEELKTMNYKILAIVGASGSGKSMLVKEILKSDNRFHQNYYGYDDNAIISNFETPESAVERLSASGLNSIPTWVKPRRVLSTGEGFRADMAINIDPYTIFDEYTSVVNRSTAYGCSKGIHRYIIEKNLDHVVFASCHKDFLQFLQPDVIIDLDYGKVFDTSKFDWSFQSACRLSNQSGRTCGQESLLTIII